MATRFLTLTQAQLNQMPPYWKTSGFNDKVANGAEVTIAATRLEDFPNITGDTLQVNGAAGDFKGIVTGVYKAGFEYRGGKVKAGHIIFTVRVLSNNASVGLAGWAVSLVSGISPKAFVTPSEAFVGGSTGTGTGTNTGTNTGSTNTGTGTGSTQKPAGTKDVFGLADFLERALVPLVVLAAIFFAFKFTK